jgi:hypothetical protein
MANQPDKMKPPQDKPRVWRLALVNLALYSADMACAIAGFVLGFGLEVKSWAAVLGFMLLSRWVVFVVRGAWEMQARKREARHG